MNQKFSLILFASGLPSFLGTCGELLLEHQTWHDLFVTPTGVAHLLLIGASFTAMLVGALGIQLPRNSSFGTRITDKKENEPTNNPSGS